MDFESKLKKDKKSGTATLEITIPVDELQAYKTQALQIHTREGEIPGFRKGKAPPPRVRAYFGAEVIDDFALRLLACETTSEALEKEKISAAGKINLEINPPEDDKPVTITATFTTGEGDEEPQLPWPNVGDSELDQDDKPYGTAPDYLRRARR